MTTASWNNRYGADEGSKIGLGQIVGASAIVMALGAGAAWAFLREESPRQVMRAAILVDASITAAEGKRCDDIEQVGAALYDEAEGDLSITILATGDSTTGNEPEKIDVVSRVKGTSVLEGIGAEEEARPSFLKSLRAVCDRIPSRKESPIFRGVQSVIRSFTKEDCAPSGHECRLYVRTDGLEEADETVQRRLQGSRVRKPGPARIDNRSIPVKVTFCGLSQRTVRRSKAELPGIDAVDHAFRPEFVDHDVRFDGQCGLFQRATPKASSAHTATSRR